MANPFLMDDDLEGGDCEPAVNPFLMQSGGAEAVLEEETFDNPFGGAGACNPFAFGDEAETEAPTGGPSDLDPAMSFFGTTIEAEDDNLSLKSVQGEEEDKQGRYLK